MDAMERSEADGVGISDRGGQGRARGKDETQMVVGNQNMVICLAPIHVCQTSSARRVRYGELGNIASKAVVKYISTI